MPSKLAIATLVFVSMRVLAVLSLGFTKGKLDKAEAQDAYILLVNSNFFLWAALFIGANAIAPDVMYGINDNAAQQLRKVIIEVLSI